MMKETVLFTLLLLWAGSGSAYPAHEGDEKEDIMQDILGLRSMMSEQEDRTSDKDAGEVPMAIGKEKALVVAASLLPTASPTPSTTTMTIPTPATAPTPGVVTMTSAPENTDKYLKKIHRLLFAILLVATAIFTLMAAKFVLSAVIKISTADHKPTDKTPDKKIKLTSC